MQRAVRVFAPAPPPVRRYYSDGERNDPAEVARRDRETQMYRIKFVFYERLRDGLLAVVTTWKSAFLSVQALIDRLLPQSPTPTWGRPIPPPALDLPLAAAPTTSAITRNAPPALSTPDLPGATA